jgi:LPS O-antigen subunit length determinant protein (WzzB/FepE family)
MVNDAGCIESLRQELSKYHNQLEDDEKNIKINESLLRELHNKEESSQSLILTSKQREYELHKLEENCRQKLTFFTDVALFYGKLSMLLEQVEDRINDVFDIVEELNDSTPTIIDFDSSEGVSISLKQALEKFDQFLCSEPIS